MILTGPAIRRAIANGEVRIDPFDPERLSPNAYDWSLHSELWRCPFELDAAKPTS